ncbi:MAG: 2-dehydropantoate 2-reductase [Beijerinckiaceae bacterium]|jgi:2-dehydropantoate 2-reductase
MPASAGPPAEKVLLVGAGAIGAPVAAWLAENQVNVWVCDTGETLAALKAKGITTYLIGAPDETRRQTRVNVAGRFADVPDADIVLLAVKNYNLPFVAADLRAQLGDRPVIVSLANGTDNQSILPPLFSKVIYGIVGFNARCDRPAVVGYQKRGPLILGTLDTSLEPQLRRVQALLSKACPTETVSNLGDAVHTKIVMNLTNALDALVGHGYVPLSNFDAYQHLLSQTLWEGVRIVRAAGYKEHAIAGLPSFSMLRLATLLPRWIARPIFRRKLRAMVMSSMTQDVALHGAQSTELESLTGYIVRLARRYNVPAPYNTTIYRLGRERFRPGFKPMRCEDVLAEVERTRKNLREVPS